MLVGVIGSAACRVQEVPRTRDDPNEIAQEDIDAARDAYRQALLNGNADAVADVFTRDATLGEPNAPDIVGSAEIEAAMRRLFAHAVVTDLLLEPDPLDIGTLGTASEWGLFEQTLQMPEVPPLTLRGRYTIRWLRSPDGEWRIDHMMYNFYPADPAPDTSATR